MFIEIRGYVDFGSYCLWEVESGDCVMIALRSMSSDVLDTVCL
jgi:hypothetical protein